jgi:hypothetical protein
MFCLKKKRWGKRHMDKTTGFYGSIQDRLAIIRRERFKAFLQAHFLPKCVKAYGGV